MEQCKIVNMYDLNETIAKEYMETAEYPWELLDGLSDYIKRLGATLDPEKYEKRGEDVWVAKNAKVAPTAFLGSPLIIDEEAEVRHCAFIRGSAIVGKGAVVGNSTELKNVILLTKYRFRITTMWAIRFLDTKRTWGQVPLLQMSSLIKHWL